MVFEKAVFWNTGNAMSTGAQAASPQLAVPLPSSPACAVPVSRWVLFWGFLSHSGIVGVSRLPPYAASLSLALLLQLLGSSCPPMLYPRRYAQPQGPTVIGEWLKT